MSFDDLLGHRATLTVRRLSPHGAFLARDATTPDAPTVLLPQREVTRGLAPGAPLEVFIARDSEDRSIATLRTPRLLLGEVAFLTATDTTNIGAFFDWGLVKELLVSKREQTCDIAVGDRYAIALVIDTSGPAPRLAGTMRISERLGPLPALAAGDWVDGEAWRHDPAIGTFVILARRGVGLIPHTEPQHLDRGQPVRVRVAQVLADGKLMLSLRAPAHEQMQDDGAVILAALARPHPPRLGDDASPELIRNTVGLSKKAFKRAVGGLLKRGQVTLDDDRCVVLASRTVPGR